MRARLNRPWQNVEPLPPANGLTNVRGSLAMARTSDADSATGQYDINVVDNPSCDYKSDEEPGYSCSAG